MHIHWLPMCFRRREPETSGISHKNSINNSNSNNTSSISKLERTRKFFRPARANDITRATVAEHDQDHDKIEQTDSSDQASRPTPVPITRPSLLNSNALTNARPRRTHSEQQHADYLAKLEVPTLDQISSIAQVQEANERELLRKYEEQEARIQKELDEEEDEEALKRTGTAGEDGGRNVDMGLDSAQRQDQEEDDSRRKQDAAGKIQRTYRGHRARREMAGLTLDPTTRWVEVLKSARYQNLTDPKKRRVSPGASASASPDRRPPNTSDSSSAAAAAAVNQRSMEARSNWHHVSNIASHAMGEIPDDDTPRASMSPERTDVAGKRSSISKTASRLSQDLSHPSSPLSPSKKDKKKKKKRKKPWAGKMMDLPYFLEMVDVKHRYGSNLRAYHAEWKKRDTHQNFFYWLDYGEGRDVEIDAVSRDRLEKEQVRYLSREERLSYLVKVDSLGRLIWAKNGERITTSTDYRDSVDGIVPTDSKTKMFREDEIKEIEDRKTSRGGSSSDDGEDRTDSEEHDHDDDDDDGTSSSFSLSSATASPTSDLEVSDAERRYPDPPSSDEEDSDNEAGDGNNPASSSTTDKQRNKKKKTHKQRASKKVRHVSAHAILNRLLRKTLSKNTWIFTADTAMNLYVGIKQSGSFQHSSFMNGSRISAAGTIKIKDGQLRALNPLSGHYRPPARAFRHFVRHLRAEHVDMSRVSISKSYAVLVGLEAYIGGRKKVQKAERKVKHGAGLVIHPAQARREREKEKDHSRSAEIERERTRKEKGTLSRVLEDARERVEERWTALREPEVGQEGHAEGGEVGETAQGSGPAPATPATAAAQSSGKGGAAPASSGQDPSTTQTQAQAQQQTEPKPTGPSATATTPTTTTTPSSIPHDTNTQSEASPGVPNIPLPNVPDHQTGLDQKYKADDQDS